MNCGALPDNLFESELFGYEKGAFTGAMSTKVGRFELADGGTLLLDEVGELSLKSQVDFLRVLETKEFRRLGGTKLHQSRYQDHSRYQSEIWMKRSNKEIFEKISTIGSMSSHPPSAASRSGRRCSSAGGPILSEFCDAASPWAERSLARSDAVVTALWVAWKHSSTTKSHGTAGRHGKGDNDSTRASSRGNPG